MSVDYAAGLSYCDDLGDCGLDEVFDKTEDVNEKVKLLASLLRNYRGSCVVHVGAGLSTSAGIRDFRGKGGVWTELLRKESKSTASTSKVHPPVASSDVVVVDDDDDDEAKVKVKVENSDVKEETVNSQTETLKPFDETEPTKSHLILKALCELGYVKHIISQNVDGLFLKANLARKYISELHGNFYLDECTKCRSRFIRGTCSPTMRLQRSNVKCPRNSMINDKVTCTGYLRDTILDWDSSIPYNELRVAMRESKRNKLHICIGTSLQLKPSKDLVCKPNNLRKLVIINLQPTKFDQLANLVINFYADDVMSQLATQLGIDVPTYDSSQNPTKDLNLIGTLWKK